jgi:hypothetical protein
VLRQRLAGDGVIEHPAYRDTINICGFDAETDKPAPEYIHDQHDLVTAQENGFAAKQIDAPKAVFDMAHEDKPRRAVGSRAVWSVVLREHATHDIFVDVEAESMRDLLRDAYTAELGIAALKLHDRRDEFYRRAFGTGFAPRGRGGKEQAVFSIDQGIVKLEQRRGLYEAPSFSMRFRNSVVSPSTKRSRVVRFGARCLDRLLIRS